MAEKIDQQLFDKINTALHSTLMTTLRAMCNVGLSPATALKMLRARLDEIEETVRKEAHDAGTAVDVPVHGTPGERAESQTPLVEAEAEADQQPSDVRGERGGKPAQAGPEEYTEADCGYA